MGGFEALASTPVEYFALLAGGTGVASPADKSLYVVIDVEGT